MSKFPQTVFKVFQQYGLTVTSKIIDYLKDVFEEKEVPQEEWIESLSNIAEEYQSDLLPKLVDLDNLDKLIKRLQDTALDATVEDEIMLDAQTESNQPTQLSQQLYREDNITDLEVDPRKFFHIHNIFDINNYKLFDDKETITMRLKERRDLIRKKIMHKEELERNGPKLVSIKDLAGRIGGSFRLLGVISMIRDENKIFLDDMDGSIELDLSPYSGEMEFVLEDTFVVVDGTYSENDEDEIFLVKDVHSPPHEKREITKDEFGYEGYWTPKHPIRDLDVIKSYEAKLMQTQFVILSNVELDNPKTLRKLSMLFKKYQSEAQKGRVFPFFVFIGNFISWKFSYEDHNTKTYRDYMTSLGVLISRYHDLAQNAYFVFVPGSNDPSLGPESLPKPKIPDIFTDRLRAMVSNASFVSNPCRLKYFTKEIVIFHEGDRMLLQTVPLHKTKEITKESLKMQATAGNEMWKSHLDDCLCFNPKPFATGWGYYQPNINEYKSKEHGED